MSNSYYSGVNPELLACVPLAAKRILEVGCGEGNFGKAYLARNPSAEYVGVELFVDAAHKAAAHLSHVITGDIEQPHTLKALEEVTGKDPFDTLIFGDVLEHLRDPWRVLAELRNRLVPGGTCVACIPNVAHWSVLLQQLNGRWDYTDSGLLDRTHIRFFTRATAVEMFQEAGWTVVDAIPRIVRREKTKAALGDFAALAKSIHLDPEKLNRDLSASQWLIRAVNAFPSEQRIDSVPGGYAAGAVRNGAMPSQQEMDAVVGLFAQGRYAEAAAVAQEMTKRFPLEGFGWKVLGAVHRKLGHSKTAVAYMSKAVALLPLDAETHSNLGVTFKDLGRLDEAETSCRRALEINTHLAEAHSNLGNILKDLGRLSEAGSSYRRALAIKPEYAEAHINLGNTLRDRSLFDEAEASYRRALAVKADYAEAYGNLAVTLKGAGRFREAEVACRRGLAIKPEYANGYSNLSAILMETDRPAEAAVCCRRALKVKPDHVMAHENLGVALQAEGSMDDDAETSFRRALAIKPDYAEAYSNLGNTLKEMDRLGDAEASYRRAIALKPDFATAHSNLIFALDLMVGVDTAFLQGERRRWGEVHAANLLERSAFPHSPDPERRLRIGYVSADFQKHSAAYVFGAALVEFDRSRFDVVAYANSATEDAFTELFQKNVTSWRNIVGLSDSAAAELIRQDQVDILVDLSGHSAGNRLLVFARKPAPVQVTAWGYIGGTGVKAVDAFLADSVAVPPAEKHSYSEEVRYLPNAVCAYFPHAFPEINPLPALTAAGVTFGSFNRLVKNSEETYRTWAQVLLALPGSRMVLKASTLDDARNRERVLERFAREGIGSERLVLLGKTSRAEHLAAFNGIDIALDPFPHGGGVTALEGMMMGVPMVSLRWGTLWGRVSASILTTLGLTDWIAETPQQYVDIAMRKAQDLEALAALRHALRGRLASSVIGDHKAYVRAVESEYRQLWREWCERRHAE